MSLQHLLFQIITEMKPHEGGYTLLQRLKDGFRFLLRATPPILHIKVFTGLEE